MRFLSLLFHLQTHILILSEAPLPTLLKNVASLPLAHSLHPPHLALTFFLHRTDYHFCHPSFPGTEAQEAGIFVPYLLTQPQCLVEPDDGSLGQLLLTKSVFQLGHNFF